MKACKACGETKPLEQFQRAGDYPNCRACVSIYNRKYKEANRERIKALNAAGYQRNRARRSALGLAWAKANPEKIRAIKRRYYGQERVHHHYADLRASQRERLSECYVRAVLRAEGLPNEYITPELIDARRAVMLINRELRRRA